MTHCRRATDGHAHWRPTLWDHGLAYRWLWLVMVAIGCGGPPGNKPAAGPGDLVDGVGLAVPGGRPRPGRPGEGPPRPNERGYAPIARRQPVTAIRVAASRSFPIPHTGQTLCFDNDGHAIDPQPGEPFFGQDGDWIVNPPSYRDQQDGTVLDEVTGLVWLRTPIAATWAEAMSGAADCRVGGHADWRVPTIKELYSLIQFSGGMGWAPPRPYLDTAVFEFHYGDWWQGQRQIDAQYWSATEYVGRTMANEPTVFGVNFADGRIKGYPRDRHPREGEMKRWVRYVRGRVDYGINRFVDHGDGTIGDETTGLMWTRSDSGARLSWQRALEWAAGDRTAGFDDWRLPNAKELQSIVDYTRAPDAADPAARGPAIDPVFQVTDPESYYWTATTHLEAPGPHFGRHAVYVCFGRALGKPFPVESIRPESRRPEVVTAAGATSEGFINVHGAGAQRSDPKSGDPQSAEYRHGFGPQRDDVRILNFVRLVRTIDSAAESQSQPGR